ncbi:MAG: carboxypeptidase-like regulatory domain-containing protein [Candidatus Thorarchaeota archaeon]
MKRIKSATVAFLIILATFSFIVAANAINIGIQQEATVKSKEKDNGNQPLFFAEITFNIFEGTGCGCVPIPGASIAAYGLDTDHNNSCITDDDGVCILEFEYDRTYRVTIEAENFQMVLFDFLVIDDQVFSFHLQEKDDSSSHNFPVLYNLLQRIESLTNPIK